MKIADICCPLIINNVHQLIKLCRSRGFLSVLYPQLLEKEDMINLSAQDVCARVFKYLHKNCVRDDIFQGDLWYCDMLDLICLVRFVCCWCCGYSCLLCVVSSIEGTCVLFYRIVPLVFSSTFFLLDCMDPYWARWFLALREQNGCLFKLYAPSC